MSTCKRNIFQKYKKFHFTQLNPEGFGNLRGLGLNEVFVNPEGF